MIAVTDSDRDILRFIWVDDVDKEVPKLKVFRFTRVVFGVSSSPFLLNATIKFHLERYLESNENVVQKLLRSTYVDDVITGADSEEAAFDLYAQAKNLFRQGGFNLRKFLTNSPELQQRINQVEGTMQTEPDNPKLSYSDETYAKAKLGTPSTSEAGEHKILGVTWNASDDCLTFDVSDLAQLAKSLQPTKRNIVSLVGKFYDPLGFLAPITIKFKILFQPNQVGLGRSFAREVGQGVEEFGF